MKFLLMMMVVAASSIAGQADAQIDCPTCFVKQRAPVVAAVQAVVSVPARFVRTTRMVPVTTYVEQEVITQIPTPVAQCAPQMSYAPVYQEQGLEFDINCAISAADNFKACRAQGGGRFGCLVQAGLGYWQCSGSTFEMSSGRQGLFSRGKARRAGRRAVRSGR